MSDKDYLDWYKNDLDLEAKINKRIEALEKKLFENSGDPEIIKNHAEQIAELKKTIERYGEMLISDEDRYDALELVLKEWIDWTLESFEIGVNDEYLEKLKNIKEKLSGGENPTLGDGIPSDARFPATDQKPPEPSFICKGCGQEVYLIDNYSKKRSYCNNCYEKDHPDEFDIKPPEPSKDRYELGYTDGYADGKALGIEKVIAEFIEDCDYIWFIMENEGIFDLVTPGDYKRLHDIKKKWEARSK